MSENVIDQIRITLELSPTLLYRFEEFVEGANQLLFDFHIPHFSGSIAFFHKLLLSPPSAPRISGGWAKARGGNKKALVHKGTRAIRLPWCHPI